MNYELPLAPAPKVWLSVVGCRLLVVGCWLLVVGCWLLDVAVAVAVSVGSEQCAGFSGQGSVGAQKR